jgi:hypothetical protein
MALGLFARQAPIGLEVPEWVTVFVAHQGDESGPHLREFVGGLATVGCRGATVVFREGARSSADPAKALRDWAESWGVDRGGASLPMTRPYFRLVACDARFFESHREEVEAGRAVYFLGRGPTGWAAAARGPLPEPPGGLGGEEGCVVLDMLTAVVGQSTQPHRMLAAAVSAEWDGPKPWLRPNWAEGDDADVLASAAVAMALNWLCKPSTYQNESFFFTSDFIDGITAKCFNERNLRPRWQDRPAAPPAPRAPSGPG